ncbi:MAG: hypothetical protein JWL89_637 [Candidatus Saccharibacteria bacterium]|nr:hypothetical protein [Candidatus Saccharibacteria bacterium]
MDNNTNPKNQLAEKLKSASNILVTVSRNPSVDQLSALLGLTLLLNKQGKHTAAVFSGEVPSTLEFLQPEETIEKNTDSLRDFIIALDKSKADKLRYKVEDNVVRIFITPYKTSITQDDLEFSQGDFNVDVVVALGVKQQEDLDDAITAHGRILHDATVTSINISAEGGLGSINWQDPQASSLSELVTELAPILGENLLDTQIATALLTGIVAETARFSNEKTSSMTMSTSATLMAAGANQQLVASKLDEDKGSSDNGSGNPAPAPEDPPKSNDGTLAIEHEANEGEEKMDSTGDSDKDKEASSGDPQVKTDQYFQLPTPEETPETEPANAGITNGPKLVTEPPTMGGQLTANTSVEGLDPSTDPLSAQSADQSSMMNRDKPAARLNPLPEPTEEPAPAPEPAPSLTPPPSDWTPPVQDDPLKLASEQGTENHTLADLEESVHATHTGSGQEIDAVRDEVNKALNSSAAPLPSQPPIQALNAQPMGGDSLHAAAPPTPPPQADQPTGNNLPSVAVSPDGTLSTAPAPQVTDPTAPPPVPPPIPFQFGTKQPPQNQQ